VAAYGENDMAAVSEELGVWLSAISDVADAPKGRAIRATSPTALQTPGRPRLNGLLDPRLRMATTLPTANWRGCRTNSSRLWWTALRSVRWRRSTEQWSDSSVSRWDRPYAQSEAGVRRCIRLRWAWRSGSRRGSSG